MGIGSRHPPHDQVPPPVLSGASVEFCSLECSNELKELKGLNPAQFGWAWKVLQVWQIQVSNPARSQRRWWKFRVEYMGVVCQADLDRACNIWKVQF